MTHLRRRWLEVLAAEDAALDSAGRARLIASEESRTHSRRLATDRKWLETVDWGGLPTTSRLSPRATRPAEPLRPAPRSLRGRGLRSRSRPSPSRPPR